MPPISLPHFSANLGNILSVCCLHVLISHSPPKPFQQNPIPSTPRCHQCFHEARPKGLFSSSVSLNIYTEFHVVGDTHLLETLCYLLLFFFSLNSRQSVGWAILPNFPMFERPRVQSSVTSSTNPLPPSLKCHLIHTDDSCCNICRLLSHQSPQREKPM